MLFMLESETTYPVLLDEHVDGVKVAEHRKVIAKGGLRLLQPVQQRVESIGDTARRQQGFVQLVLAVTQAQAGGC